MKTIVLDDDPTGTQCATGVTVLLTWDVDAIVKVLKEADSVYLQTNSRALNEADAVSLTKLIKIDGDAAGLILGEEIEYVLRGDSTLRGHVFSETQVFLNGKNSILFLPAYPDVGRTTIDGVHYVRIEGTNKRADETEFASDPVFSFKTSTMVDFVAEKTDRKGVRFSLAQVREGAIPLSQKFSAVSPGSVIVPDAENDSDIEIISDAVKALRKSDAPLVVRSAAPLAASLAGVRSKGLLQAPLKSGEFATLLVAGSHTEGATKQLAQIAARWGDPELINTDMAMKNPAEAAERAISGAKRKLSERNFAIVASERTRLAEHNTLEHGGKVMDAIISTVQSLCAFADVVVAKGGITSAEVARAGIGAKEGWVLGQILPGISVWKVKDRTGRELMYVVVPGNVGDPDTLMKVLEIVGVH